MALKFTGWPDRVEGFHGWLPKELVMTSKPRGFPSDIALAEGGVFPCIVDAFRWQEISRQKDLIVMIGGPGRGPAPVTVTLTWPGVQLGRQLAAGDVAAHAVDDLAVDRPRIAGGDFQHQGGAYTHCCLHCTICCVTVLLLIVQYQRNNSAVK
jgi:hypothetical protein